MDTLIIAVQQVPGLASAFWPSGTGTSQVVQVGALDTTLGTASDQIGTILNNGLALVMNNIDDFVLFAGNGTFSGSASISVPAETNNLDLALKTYLVSESLNQNKWYAAYTGSTIIKESCAFSIHDECEVTTPLGYFVSPDTGRHYTLMNSGGNTQLGAGILRTIESNQWASSSMLFDGAFDCTASGKCSSRFCESLENHSSSNYHCLRRESRRASCQYCGEWYSGHVVHISTTYLHRS